MRSWLVLTVSFFLSSIAMAGNPYHAYLLTKVPYSSLTGVVNPISTPNQLSAAAFTPRYETPKGAVFCRMEDIVTRTTKVWLKLGVQ